MAKYAKRAAKRANRPNPREDRNHTPRHHQRDVDFRQEQERTTTARLKKRVDILPRNLHQESYVDALMDDANHVVFAMGPAGCGKTLLATQYAVKMLLEGSIDRVVVTRPAVSVDEQHGFLPGDLTTKMAPWTRPILDVLREYFSPQQIERMIMDEVIEIAPLAYMRGRAEPLNAMIPTPIGYRRMGDIQVGDFVYGSDGRPTKVTGVFPQGKKEVVDVEFSDGSIVRCSKDHLWNTRTSTQRNRNKPFTTKTAGEIQATIRNKHGHKNHEIPLVSSPVEIATNTVPLDPYLLGCLLGDGTISKGSIHFTTADKELTELISRRLPDGVEIKKNNSTKTEYDYYITGNKNRTNPVKNVLRDLGIWGRTSSNKKIPSCYLQNSADVRLELLRGLMDTDGSIFSHRSGKSRVQFYSTSRIMAEQVKWIVETLGGVARIRVKKTPKNGSHTSGFGHNHDVCIVDMVLPAAINPFKLSRKANLFNPVTPLRLISDVRDAGEEECQCISVAAPDHLYLTNNFVVTHNTFKNAIILFDEAQNATPSQMKMVLTRIGEGARMIVTGDLKQHDRGYEQNGLKDFLERLSEGGCRGIKTVRFDATDVERHPVIEDILRIYGED